MQKVREKLPVAILQARECLYIYILYAYVLYQNVYVYIFIHLSIYLSINIYVYIHLEPVHSANHFFGHVDDFMR